MKRKEKAIKFSKSFKRIKKNFMVKCKNKSIKEKFSKKQFRQSQGKCN